MAKLSTDRKFGPDQRGDLARLQGGNYHLTDTKSRRDPATISCEARRVMNDKDQDSEPQGQSIVDLDVLRGWSEHRDPALRRGHRLPALAEFIQLGDDGPVCRYTIHGPDVLLGRFQSRYAPVDVLFDRLQDHQVYRLGAPHAHLNFADSQWHLQVLSPRSTTLVDGEPLEHLHKPRLLDDGDELTLGVTRFRFQSISGNDGHWRHRRQELLETVARPALFLKRRGGLCGPHRLLDEDTALVLGRTFPIPGTLPDTNEWPERDKNHWDLSGLYDFERRYIAFRHARIERDHKKWTITPVSSRQQTFVNRIAISEKIALQPGDEIGLGSVLLHFHHPDHDREQERERHIPTAVDWSEGRRPTPPKTENK